jgi:hypothetical protein
MEIISSHSEEKSLEEAHEMGRKDEQEIQYEREQAKEEGIKQGLEEGRIERNQRRGPGTGMKIILCLIVFAIIGVIIAYLTLSVSITNISPGNSLPFTTKYIVSFPEGQMLTIGNTHITVLSYQNVLISDIDGDRQKLVVGTNRVISERRAVITTFRSVTLMDTIFKIDLNYSGDRDNRAYFDLAVHTSEQVPDMLIKRLIPPDIDARPI